MEYLNTFTSEPVFVKGIKMTLTGSVEELDVENLLRLKLEYLRNTVMERSRPRTSTDTDY